MPSVEITESVSRKLHIDKCPCCGSSNVSAYSGHTCMDGEAYGVVHCQRCGHKVSEQRYGWSENTALESAVGAWNTQAKAYGIKSDFNKNEYIHRIETKDKVIKILKFFLERDIKVDSSMLEMSDEVLVLNLYDQLFGNKGG